MTRAAVITIVAGRHDHLHQQLIAFGRTTCPPDIHVVVSMGDPTIRARCQQFPGVHVVELEPFTGGLPLARARNMGAAVALELGCELLIFLDVDCLPDLLLTHHYAAASKQLTRPALLCGPVTYLPPAGPKGYALDNLAALRNPHPARPVPTGDSIVIDGRAELFWSLSFALDHSVWNAIGGFDVRYTGYGGEDTDFAFRARSLGIPIAWVGGAHAYHQHHEVSNPPVEHLHDILANAHIFHATWKQWPMLGWLHEFEKRGLIEYDQLHDRWHASPVDLDKLT